MEDTSNKQPTWIEIYKKHDSVSTETKEELPLVVRFTSRFPREVYLRVRKMAKARNMTRNQFLIFLSNEDYINNK